MFRCHVGVSREEKSPFFILIVYMEFKFKFKKKKT